MIKGRIVAATCLAVILAAVSQQVLATELDEARARIIENLPELDAAQISPSPVPGLYEISEGGRVAYATADGRYVLQGDLYDVKSEINLTEASRVKARVAAVDRVAESSMIIFEPEQATHTITVFTDIDCGYCRKLHRQIAEYNAEGIRVRYLFFPRSGPNTESWFKADEVWCADDRNSALTRAKSGEKINSADCGKTPVGQHYRLGESLGIRGTPAIILETGDLIPGYVPPEELLEILERAS